MSGFIPMVSTTPPPIDDDDDDFGDFMDGSQAEQDDFGDFSSPVNYNDFSYPSLSSEDVSNATNIQSETESPVGAKDDFFKNQNKGNISADDKEVKVISTSPESGSLATDGGLPIEEISTCNGSTDAEVLTVEGKHDVAPQVRKNRTTDIDAEDWMDFEAMSSHPCGSESDDPHEVHENPCANSSTCEASPELNGENFQTQDEGDDAKKENAHQNTVCTEDEGIQAFSKDITAEVSSDCDVRENLPEDSSPYEEHDFPSCNENIDDNEHFQSSETSEHGPDEKENKPDSFETVQPIDPSSIEPQATKTFVTDSQSHNSASSARLPSSSNDSDSEFCDFPTLEPNSELANVGGQENFEEESRYVAADPVAVEDHKFHTDTDLTDFESLAHVDSDVKHVDHDKDCETVASDKTEDGNTFGAFESSEYQASQTAETFQADFGAFPSSSADDREGDSDFADFGSSTELPKKGVQTDDDCDNNVSTGQDSEFAAFGDGSSNNDGFADFSNGCTDQEPGFGDFSTGDDDFADFSASTSTWASFSNTVMKKLSLKDKVANYRCRFFEDNIDVDPEDEERILQLDEHLRSNSLPESKNLGSPSTASVESIGILCPGDLWDQLEDIDNAIALNFLWNGSGHNKHLLNSLGMYTQNILFSGAKQAYYVPAYYAAGLGLVDPNKGILKPMSAAEKITAISPTDKSFPASKEDLHTEESHTEWKTIADDRSSESSMHVDGSWLRDVQVLGNDTGSDLTTGSDPVPIISSAMDLDFFDSLPSVGDGEKQEGNTDLIDPELLELTTAPTTEPPPPPKDSGSATLSKLLASITSSNNNQSGSAITPNVTQDNSKWDEEESKLSAEARSVLKRLPSLSYMRAKVLMFPINMSRVHISDD